MENRQKYTDWMSERGYGIFTHYLYTPEHWATFDVERAADAIAETGAGWYVLTIGQNNGYYCAPNDTYEAIVGYEKGTKCSQRDIPMEMADALAKRDIKMMLYLPSNPPFEDELSGRKFGSTGCFPPPNSDWYSNDTVVENWSKVIRDYAVHYGSKICGWWFDGFYEHLGLREEHGQKYFEAVTAGNPEAIMCLNRGVDNIIYKANKYCDYTTGERDFFDNLPTERFVDGAQWHILSYLGTWWGDDSVRYDSDYMASYIRKVMEKGGGVSIDVHINGDGSINENQLDVLRNMKKKLGR